MPEADAFLIVDGHFAAVGTREEVSALAGDTATYIDLQGLTVLPGFNDAHLHPLLIPPGAISLASANNVDQLVSALSSHAQAMPKSTWVLGFEYDAQAIGRHLNRRDLDRVSTARPVLAWHASGHLAAVNSLALRTAGLDKDFVDPVGGFFYRDKAGQPTGLISERPAFEVLFVNDQPSPMVSDLSGALSGLELFAERAHSLGITSVTDALVPPELALAYWLWSPEDSGLRVNLILDGDSLTTAKRLIRANDITSRAGFNAFGNAWLRARSIKIFHGHSLSGRTTRLHTAYEGRPDYFGVDPQRSQAELDALVLDIHNAGIQAAIHANGDYEIDMALNAIEKAIGRDQRDHRHRIEHGSVVNSDILQRMADLNIVYAPHSYIYEKGPMIDAYGAHRWNWMFANASSFEYGIPNAANSDFPISGLSPMLRIQSLVTRKSRGGKIYGPQQRISVEQALYAYTMGSAFASFEDKSKGSITTGKFADFIVVSQDPRQTAPELLSKIEVQQTYVAGIKRFDRYDGNGSINE